VSSPVAPEVVLDLLAKLLPRDLHGNVVLVGSLAAAYHHRERVGGSVRTKDADVMVQPAGALLECRRIGELLIAEGWRPMEWLRDPAAEGVRRLPVARLVPPSLGSFYVELIGVPSEAQEDPVSWIPYELYGTPYVLPCHRFLVVALRGALTSGAGIRYAAPGMMALSNILSHRRLGTENVREPIEGLEVRRSSKDLGRVLVLAQLAGLDEMDTWLVDWADALCAHFRDEADALASDAGRGLRELLDDPSAMEEARHVAEVGLLRGQGIDVGALRAVAARLFSLVLEPLPALVAERLKP